MKTINKNQEVKTLTELNAALHPDGQGSGTVEGWVEFQGRNFWIRKHWSNEYYCCHDFEPYYDEPGVFKFPPTVGTLEIIQDTRREWFKDGVQQLHHGIWPYYDFDLQFIPTANDN